MNTPRINDAKASVVRHAFTQTKFPSSGAQTPDGISQLCASLKNKNTKTV